MFEIIVETAFIIGILLAVIYATLSFMYYTYRYAKGDNHPGISDLDLHHKDILKLINPFYYKHPMNICVTAMIFVGVPAALSILAIVWYILIPVCLLGFMIHRMRCKNLQKKKTWEILKR